MSAQNLFDYDELAADPLDLSDSRQNRHEDTHDETRSRDSEPEEETEYSRDGSTTLRDTPTVYDEDERPLPEPVRKTIIDTHQTVWNEFYRWEYDFSAKKIAIFADEPQEEDSYAYLLAAYDRSVKDRMDVDSDIPQAGASDDDDSAPRKFTIYSDFETKTTTSIVLTRPITVTPPLPPHPKYEACTPSDCNIWLNGPKPVLNFIKYDGEIDKHGLEFDSRKYMSDFDRVTWIDDRIDPDHLVIASKTVQILTEWQRNKLDSLVGNKIRVTYEDIDRLGIFSAFGKDVEDLEFEMRQR
ncbi:hypothetical protein PHLCEN_2v2930 [Hermanssonia centrifuga]|uniref:Uncharacterized protein n=1 Tax=Hermanssonia centrifuga TaxID=98765 RepID=A0A2R6RIC9_9APHY|nr:hypothetical protein PHLCEN_2v2930 [Hermanssonia centrifuga]